MSDLSDRKFNAYRKDNGRIPLWALYDWYAYEMANEVANLEYDAHYWKRKRGFYSPKGTQRANGDEA